MKRRREFERSERVISELSVHEIQLLMKNDIHLLDNGYCLKPTTENPQGCQRSKKLHSSETSSVLLVTVPKAIMFSRDYTIFTVAILSSEPQADRLKCLKVTLTSFHMTSKYT